MFSSYENLLNYRLSTNKMSNKILKISSAIPCSYIVFAKIYVTIYYTLSDMVEHFSNFIVCCSCISLFLIIFGKIRRIRYTFIFITLLLFGIYTQTIIEGFNALSQRRDVIYPSEYLWIYDIPNILSILEMICLLILIVIKAPKM